jgi:hypothetical protein
MIPDQSKNKFPSVYDADFRKKMNIYFENKVEKICLETNNLNVLHAYEKLITIK